MKLRLRIGVVASYQKVPKFDTVDFLPKAFLIMYPSLENSTTGIAITLIEAANARFSVIREVICVA